MATYASYDEANKAYQDYLKTVQFTNAAGERYGQLNLPSQLPVDQKNFQPGGQYFDFSKGDAGGTSAQLKEINDLISSGTYRDIPANIIGDFTSGKITKEQAIQQIKGTPIYNPALGPQMDIGQGKVPYNPTVITSQPAQQQYANSTQTIQSGIQNLNVNQPSATGGTLYDYYTSQGKPLPSLQERGALYEKMGLGTASDYISLNQQGNAGPNTKLLEALQKQSGMTTTPQAPKPLTISSSNPALQASINSVNNSITQYLQAGGQMTPEMQAAISKLNTYEDAKTTALTAGQTAQQNGDTKGVNTAAAAVSDYETKIQKELADFKTQIQPLREAYLKSLMPSQDVTDYKKKLVDIKNKLNADLGYTKGQPIQMGFIAGQTAQLKEQAALDEANMINLLGLAQDAQEAQQKVAKGELDFATQDYELASKIADKLKASEDDLVQQVRQQSADKQSFYANVAKTFAETNLSNNPDATKQLQQLALDSGADPSLALAIAKNSYNQTLFENNLKTQAAKNAATKATTDKFGQPTAADESAVRQWLVTNPTEAKSVDQNRLKTDYDYFYWVKSQIGL